MDIKSLYTVIPKEEGLQMLKHFPNLRITKDSNTETLLHLTELVLTFKRYSFVSKFDKQMNCVAMGIKMGPSYVSLFFCFIGETNF